VRLLFIQHFEKINELFMTKSTGALLGFVLGFMVVYVSCARQVGNWALHGGPLIVGCILGGVFAILGSLLGKGGRK
jgi:hypothetical protein